MYQLLGEMPPSPAWERPWLNESTGTSWWYPVCIMIGFAVAIILACLKMWKRYKVSTEPFYWFILIGVPTAIFGARFGSCAIGQTEWRDFFNNFGSGLAIEWGVMLTVLAAFIYFPLILKLPRYKVRDEFGLEKPEIRRVSMWMYFDAVIPAMLIGQFIGRWGNYCNQEVFGRTVTDEGLANFLYKVLPGMYIDGEWKQPLFFWEGIGNLAMFFVLFVGCEFIKQRKAGDLTGAYFVWYGVFRSCLEPLRDNQFGFIVSIVTSIIWACIGVIFIVMNHLLIASERKNKLLRTLLNFGPIEYFGLIDIGLREFVINFKNKKIKTKEKRKEIIQKILLSCDESKRKSLEQKMNKLCSQINKLQQSVETKTKKIEEIKVSRKQKRALKIEKNYNSFVNKQKKKYKSLSHKFNDKLQKITDEKKRLSKKRKYDNALQEINKRIADFESESIKQRQDKNEQMYQSCIRKPNEMIYFGKW